MRTILPVILPLFLAAGAPASGAECDRWTAGMEETEGGSAMVARICAGNGDEFFLQCGGPGQFMLRLIPSVAENYPPGDNYNFATRFSFDNGSARAELDMRFEAMDAAMAGEVQSTDPVVGLLKTGDRLTLTDLSASLPAASFTLDGAKDALGALEAGCRAP